MKTLSQFAINSKFWTFYINLLTLRCLPRVSSKSMRYSKIFIGSIFILAFFLPVSQLISVRLLLVISILALFTRQPFNLRKKLLKSWHLLFYLLVLTIGLFNSTDINQGLKVLETNFCFLAIPLILGFMKSLDERFLCNILFSLLLGMFSASLLCLIYGIYSWSINADTSAFFFYQFTNILDFQPTYFAYFLCFGISVLLYFNYYGIGKFPVWANTITIGFFFVILMLTAGRTAYIAMLFVFAFFILKFLFEEERHSNTTLTFGISSILLISMLLINYLDINSSLNLSENNNDYWERLALWKSGLLANTNFLFGVGTGDYKIILNDYFLHHGLAQYAKENFNTHNQFIQSFLSNGLIGVISLLILMGRPLYLSVKRQNVLGIMTFFSFFIYGITEVFLGRYQGVVFFAFLNQVFVTHYLSEEQTNDSKRIK